MPLKAIYETESEVPEALKEFYAPKGDKWELQAEGIKTQGDVDRVSEALRKERADAKAAKDRLALFGDLDPATLRTTLDEYEVLKAQVATGAGVDEEKLTELRTKIENQVKAPLTREVEALRSKYEMS